MHRKIWGTFLHIHLTDLNLNLMKLTFLSSKNEFSLNLECYKIQSKRFIELIKNSYKNCNNSLYIRRYKIFQIHRSPVRSFFVRVFNVFKYKQTY